MAFILTMIERRFWLLTLASSCLIFYLNYYGADNQSFYDLYMNQAHIIKSGFNVNGHLAGPATFPVWGYGWLYTITDSSPVIMVLQNLLMLASLIVIINYLSQERILPARALLYVKILVALSFPWFAYHSKIWPNSIAISLYILSLFLWLRYLRKPSPKLYQVMISGVLFGIALNFRSDYLLLPFAIVLIPPLCRTFSLSYCKRALAWLASIYIVLLPWMFFSHHAAGHYLLTSTNSGHVAFISLGNLPGNKWGIQPGDDDPLMHKLLRQEFGEEKAKQRVFSATYEADVFLKREFIKRVQDDPGEFVRKIAHNAVKVTIAGTYSGRFLEMPGQDGKQNFIDMLTLLTHSPAQLIKYGPGELTRFFLQAFSLVIGRVVVFASFILLPLVLFFAWKQKSIFWLTVIALIGYQTALNVILFQMPAYTTNVYLFHLLNMVQGSCIIYQLRTTGAMKT